MIQNSPEKNGLIDFFLFFSRLYHLMQRELFLEERRERSHLDTSTQRRDSTEILGHQKYAKPHSPQLVWRHVTLRCFCRLLCPCPPYLFSHRKKSSRRKNDRTPRRRAIDMQRYVFSVYVFFYSICYCTMTIR